MNILDMVWNTWRGVKFEGDRYVQPSCMFRLCLFQPGLEVLGRMRSVGVIGMSGLHICSAGVCFNQGLGHMVGCEAWG